VDESGLTNSLGKTAAAFYSLLTDGKPRDERSQSVYGVRTKNFKATRIFKHELFGDGGWIVFDPKDPRHIYGSSQNMAIYRHRRDNGWQTVTPIGADDEERNGIWMAIITMHPTDPNVVFTGSTRVWRTNNDGEDWVAVSDHLDGSPITAIEIADCDSNFIYVGTESGNIFKSADGGNRWNDEPGENLPKPMKWRNDLGDRLTIGVARTITRIEAHPRNAENVVATLMGFTGKRRRLPHVIWFDPEKNKWSPVERDGNGLPNVHHNVITWGEAGEYAFVGNDIGVWAKKTPGGNFGKYKWHDISGNLPNAIVTDLVYHHKTESLTVATYGRSLWWTDQKTWREVN
jgi:hypothetical protein